MEKFPVYSPIVKNCKPFADLLPRRFKKNCFSESRDREIQALAVFQGHCVGLNEPSCAQIGRGFVETSANQGVTPAAPSRMLTFKISFSDSRGWAISVPAISQRHHGDLCARICTMTVLGFVEISANFVLLLLT